MTVTEDGVTVGEVAEVREVEAPSAISRVDGDQAVTVTGAITSKDTSAVSNEVRSTLPKLDLPEGVTATVGGESEDIEESFRNLILSIAVALVLVYLILVFFFGSLVVPLILLLAVPLTTVGAFGALLLTGAALSVPALLGVLLLVGIVVSNAILLVDFIQGARNRLERVPTRRSWRPDARAEAHPDDGSRHHLHPLAAGLRLRR